MFYIYFRFLTCSSRLISSWDGKPANVAWGEKKEKKRKTSQIKAAIVTLTTTIANERQIGYRNKNKHFGDTDCATQQWECGHRQCVTLSPLGRPPTGRNLGMGQGACCSLLKTNLGPVIHKSLVYQCLQTLSSTQGAPHCQIFSLGVKITSSAAGPAIKKRQVLRFGWSFEKWPKSYVTLLFIFARVKLSRLRESFAHCLY